MTDSNIQANQTERKFPFCSVMLYRFISVPFRSCEKRILLYDYPTPLDETLTRHFDDNVHLFHWQPVYMIHFFLSLSSMLMSSKFQTKYGIRRVFFTCWRDEGIVRLTILTEKKFAGDRSTQKSMKVRTFNLKSKPVANRYMLSSEERKFMELLSSGRADGSIDDALSKYVVDLYKNEQALEGIDITEYPADYAVYTVNQEKIYKNDKPGPHTRIRMKFLQSYYSHKLPDDAAVEKFKSVFTGPGGLSDLFKEMMLSDGVLAECAFAHAPLFLLSYSYPTDINVNQRLSSSGDVSSVDMTILTRPKSTYSNGAPNDVPIICSFRESRAAPIKPDEAPRGLSLTGHIGGMSVSLFKKVVDTSFGSQTERCDIVHDLFHAVREGVPEQVDIGERAPEEDIGEEAAQQADMQPQFLKLIEGELEKIRPSSREYKLSEKNYLSRYFAGWIASSNHEATRCSQLLSKSGNNERSRFFLENYGQKMISKSKLRNILLIVKEEQMLEKHTLPEAELDEAYDVRYKQLKDDDTLVLNIYQEYVHTKEEFAVVDYDQDFTRYRVMYSFTKSEDVLKSHDVVQIPTTPVKNILNHLTAHGQVLRINFKALLDDNPNQKMMDIVRSANNEMQLQPNDLFFQFVVAKNDYALKGRLLDREQLTKCASRVRRSSASVCESGWTDDVEIMKEIKNKEGELEVVGKGKYGKSPNQMSIAKGSISPKAIESLKKVSKIGGYFMLGFMVRDIVSDAVNKHYGAMAKDIGFLVAAVSAPTLGELAEVSGSALVASGAEVSGNALKFVGFGLKRAISLYVFADFVENAIAYAHDTNNTEAAMSMAIDGAFVAIDLLTIAAESFGVLAFMGPLGEIAGVILLVGLNIYQTVEKLGSGSDLVNGYQEKPNIFQMADGVKNITAGRKNDVFILTHGLINGMLDASEGFDVLDLSSLTFDSLEITENMLEIITFFEKNHLLVKNFEMIILPQQDNFRGRINVLVGCEILKIVSHGEADFVIPADDCANQNIKLAFNDGSMVMFNGTFTVSATLSTNLTIKEIEHVYTEALERLGLLMVAHSFTDDETITISHGKIEVSGSPIKGHILHNSVDHSTHMMLNGGEYLILINTNQQGKIEKTTIKSRNAANITRVVIDLNQVIEYYYRENDSFVEVSAHLQSQSDLIIEISLHESGTTVELGNILIQDIFSHNLYNKISIRNYGELIIYLDDSESSVEEGYSDRNDVLIPSPIAFGNQSDVIVLTPYNVEPFNEIILDFNVVRFDYYHINKTTLVVTNARYSILSGTENMLTVFLERFYTIEKMTTLQLMIGDVPMKFRQDMDKILAAQEFSQLWEDMPSAAKDLIAS
uniref:Uncharacterized protein n=1 Tax=Romanomermis culicivorax TaxID=13658 RepID=A0A915JT28_ROMCU